MVSFTKCYRTQYNHIMPHNYGYSNRDTGGGAGTGTEEDYEDDNGIKPYTAVGAALDSASRFKRRMNYGRKPTKT